MIQQPFELAPGDKTPAALLSLDAGDALTIEVVQDTTATLELEVFFAGATTTVQAQDPVHVVVAGAGGADGDVVVHNLSGTTAKGRVVFVPGGEPSGGGEVRVNENGILQFFHAESWRGVCDDGFGQEEAVVACRQLGGSLKSFQTGQNGPSSAYWIDDLQCSGNESRIDQCSHAPFGNENCSANESVKLECDIDGTGEDHYSAVCHVDDDPVFDEGIFIVGELSGVSLTAIRDECAAIAKAMFPASNSSGLRSIKILGQPSDSDKFTAACHVDDDTTFDEGQFIITGLFGKILPDMSTECASIAAIMFPNAHSSALRNIQILGQPTASDKVIATCHVDDDPTFDEGIFIIGDVWGVAITDLEKACQAIGNAMFPGVSSSALRNIRFL